MQDYVLFTDSTTDLSPALIEEMDAVVMPMSFTLNGQSYKNYPDGREMPMADFYAALPGLLAGYDRAILLYEGGGVPLRTALEGVPENGRLALITGSEGGFAPEETEALCRAGAVQVGLGPRILRCETAPTAVLAAVMALTGNFE